MNETLRPAGAWLAPAGAAPTDLPTLPGFEILGEVGRGGMGVVYRARRLSTGELLALKLIRDGALAGPQDRTRFRIEAETAKRVCDIPTSSPSTNSASTWGGSTRPGISGGRQPWRRGSTAAPVKRRRRRPPRGNPRPCGPGGARAKDRPPGPQAGQRAADRRRRPQDRRLRTRQAPRRRHHGVDPGGGGPRHACLHGPRTGRGQDEGRRTRRRRVRAGRHPL